MIVALYACAGSSAHLTNRTGPRGISVIADQIDQGTVHIIYNNADTDVVIGAIGVRDPMCAGSTGTNEVWVVGDLRNDDLPDFRLSTGIFNESQSYTKLKFQRVNDTKMVGPDGTVYASRPDFCRAWEAYLDAQFASTTTDDIGCWSVNSCATAQGGWDAGGP